MHVGRVRTELALGRRAWARVLEEQEPLDARLVVADMEMLKVDAGHVVGAADVVVAVGRCHRGIS